MVVYTLNKDDTNLEIQAIKRVIRENKNLRMHKRYMIILSHLKGYLNYEIEFLCTNIVGTVTNNTPDYVEFIARKDWTIELIRQFVISTFNFKFSHRGMADVLYRLKLSYTSHTYILANADPEKQEIFKKDCEVLKNTLRLI